MKSQNDTYKQLALRHGGPKQRAPYGRVIITHNLLILICSFVMHRFYKILLTSSSNEAAVNMVNKIHERKIERTQR